MKELRPAATIIRLTTCNVTWDLAAHLERCADVIFRPRRLSLCRPSVVLSRKLCNFDFKLVFLLLQLLVVALVFRCFPVYSMPMRARHDDIHGPPTYEAKSSMRSISLRMFFSMKACVDRSNRSNTSACLRLAVKSGTKTRASGDSFMTTGTSWKILRYVSLAALRLEGNHRVRAVVVNQSKAELTLLG